MAKHIAVLKLSILLFLVNVISVSAITSNITQFDDGGSNFNVTTNYTGYITFPIGVNITEANVSINGLLTEWCYQETANVSTTCGGLSTGKYNVTTNYFYVNYTVPAYANSNSRWQVKHGLLSTYNISLASCWNSSLLQFRMFSNDDVPETSYSQCHNGSSWINIGNSANNSGATGSHTIGTESYLYDGDWNTYTTFIPSSSDWRTKSTSSGNTSIYEEAMWWYVGLYPLDTKIKVNNTQVFNHSGNLTSVNASIQLNKTLIQNFVSSSAIIPINFSASAFGNLNIFNLTFSYVTTNLAILTIESPTQITASLTSGVDTTTSINISNTGNWNATNISFESVSVLFSPNLNSSITHDCGSIKLINGTSVICNVTFNDLTQSAESDEKLKVRANGTDANDVIYSNSIDLDITVTPAVPQGGAGGGIIKRIETFIIVVRNFFAKETKQLGIKPASEREYCLDLISQNTTKAQTIKLSCSNPTFDEKKPCSWIEFDKKEIELSPSTEQRMPVCLQITTPSNILLGEQYVIVISGSSDQENTEIQRHTITMFVTDYSEFLKNYINIFKEDSLLKFHYTFIRQNFKSDIQELGFSIPNFIFPIILLNVLLLYLVLTQFTAKPTLKVAFSVIFYLTAGVTGMFLPAIMYLSTIILFGTYFFTRIA